MNQVFFLKDSYKFSSNILNELLYCSMNKSKEMKTKISNDYHRSEPYNSI